ncbi:E3 ubiquitin-protein ligase TRIM33-like isoform X2 [Cimex lectularius]|uniref:Uncharacterized protein n=1 Tax=Cimex lectularius TaxID=79782 RepID=A0A8I6S2K9_CIMLE|nr:E3 ubiquitin-protein ligase TRIM33-like isoform X2 [Cimex lectularius]
MEALLDKPAEELPDEIRADVLTLTACVFCKCDIINSYEDFVSSKFLECCHSVCRDCIAKWEQTEKKQCPECLMEVEKKLLDNFILQEMVDGTVIAKKNIGFCGVHTSNLTTHWCYGCGDSICEECIKYHSQLKETKSHVIKTKEEHWNDPCLRYMCKTHPKEPLQLFCFTCNLLTCRDCQLFIHRDHSYDFVTDIVDKAKVELHKENVSLRYFLKILEAAVPIMEERKQSLLEESEQIKKQINDLATLLIAKINKKKHTLLSRVRAIAKTQTEIYELKQKEVKEKMKTIKHCTCFTTNVLCNSSDCSIVQSKEHILRHIGKIKDLNLVVPNPCCKKVVNFRDNTIDIVPVQGTVGTVSLKDYYDLNITSIREQIMNNMKRANDIGKPCEVKIKEEPKNFEEQMVTENSTLERDGPTNVFKPYENAVQINKNTKGAITNLNSGLGSVNINRNNSSTNLDQNKSKVPVNALKNLVDNSIAINRPVIVNRNKGTTGRQSLDGNSNNITNANDAFVNISRNPTDEVTISKQNEVKFPAIKVVIKQENAPASNFVEGSVLIHRNSPVMINKIPLNGPVSITRNVGDGPSSRPNSVDNNSINSNNNRNISPSMNQNVKDCLNSTNHKNINEPYVNINKTSGGSVSITRSTGETNVESTPILNNLLNTQVKQSLVPNNAEEMLNKSINQATAKTNKDIDMSIVKTENPTNEILTSEQSKSLNQIPDEIFKLLQGDEMPLDFGEFNNPEQTQPPTTQIYTQPNVTSSQPNTQVNEHIGQIRPVQTSTLIKEDHQEDSRLILRNLLETQEYQFLSQNQLRVLQPPPRYEHHNHLMPTMPHVAPTTWYQPAESIQPQIPSSLPQPSPSPYLVYPQDSLGDFNPQAEINLKCAVCWKSQVSYFCQTCKRAYHRSCSFFPTEKNLRVPRVVPVLNCILCENVAALKKPYIFPMTIQELRVCARILLEILISNVNRFFYTSQTSGPNRLNGLKMKLLDRIEGFRGGVDEFVKQLKTLFLECQERLKKDITDQQIAVIYGTSANIIRIYLPDSVEDFKAFRSFPQV